MPLIIFFAIAGSLVSLFVIVGCLRIAYYLWEPKRVKVHSLSNYNGPGGVLNFDVNDERVVSGIRILIGNVYTSFASLDNVCFVIPANVKKVLIHADKPWPNRVYWLSEGDEFSRPPLRTWDGTVLPPSTE